MLIRRSMGGAIWDFVSPGLREKVMALNDASPNQVPVNVMGRARLVAGTAGKAIDLNGHDQWVEVYRDDALRSAGNELTLSLWVYPRALNSSAGTLITKGSYQFGLQQIGKDSLEFYLTTNKRYTVRTVLPADWENNWHHVVAVYDGKECRLSLDGISRTEKAVSGNISNLPFPVNIGRNAEIHGQETSDYLCDAMIDQVGVFPMAVDPELLRTPSLTLIREVRLYGSILKKYRKRVSFSAWDRCQDLWKHMARSPASTRNVADQEIRDSLYLLSSWTQTRVYWRSATGIFLPISVDLQTIWILEADGKAVS